jgi:general secretion pathway protein A
MYEAFYGLKENPFSIQPDPDYLYFGRRHSYAYAMMEFGIRNRAGFMVVSGEIGCGKTTLVRHLLNNLAPGLTVGLVYNTQREMPDLLRWFMQSLGLPYDGMSDIALFDSFQHFLVEQGNEGKIVLLIIDEAQNLSSEALENLRMLSNINADKNQFLQILLVGQPELRDMLGRPELKQFSQRIEFDFHLKPFETADAQNYIEHRLEVAGRNTPLFTPEACIRIAEVSQGVPRRINVLCNKALIYGFATGSDQITLELVEEVLNDSTEFGALSNSD